MLPAKSYKAAQRCLVCNLTCIEQLYIAKEFSFLQAKFTLRAAICLFGLPLLLGALPLVGDGFLTLH